MSDVYRKIYITHFIKALFLALPEKVVFVFFLAWFCSVWVVPSLLFVVAAELLRHIAAIGF